MPDSQLIHVNNLSAKINYNYGLSEIETLDKISFDIAEGSMVALLEAGGVNITTLTEILSCKYTSEIAGDISIAKLNLLENTKILRDIIYIPGNYVLTDALTVREQLEQFAELYHPALTRKERRVKVDALINEYDLTPKIKMNISTLTNIERKLVFLLIALISERRIFIFNDPDAGLDPVNKRKYLSYIQKAAHYSSNPKTFIIIPNNVANLDLFDQAIVLRKFDGIDRLSFSGTPTKAKEYYGITEYTEIYNKIKEDTDGSKYLM